MEGAHASDGYSVHGPAARRTWTRRARRLRPNQAPDSQAGEKLRRRRVGIRTGGGQGVPSAAWGLAAASACPPPCQGSPLRAAPHTGISAGTVGGNARCAPLGPALTNRRCGWRQSALSRGKQQDTGVSMPGGLLNLCAHVLYTAGFCEGGVKGPCSWCRLDPMPFCLAFNLYA